MSRSIAAAGRYKFGECGYIVDGAILNDGSKLKNIRIYRQRSHKLYDLVDPRTNIIYRKVQLTTKDNKGYLLNYSKSTDELLSEINKNSFFVRGHSDDHQEADTGFVYKFLLHKTILGSSKTLYNMYTPECSIIDRDIDNIIISPVFVGDKSISGKLFNAGSEIDTNSMEIKIVLPEGTEYTTTQFAGDTFTIQVDAITQKGKGTATLTSPYYNTKVVEFDVQEHGEDVDFVTPVHLSDFQPSPDGAFSAVVPYDVHKRGHKLVLQTYNGDSHQIGVDMSVDDKGNITVQQTDNSPISLRIMGKTLHTTPFHKEYALSDWKHDEDSMYSLSIPATEHGKALPQVQLYSSDKQVIHSDLQVDEDDNVIVKVGEPLDCSVVIVGYNE
ncbi:hypothetical protein UES1_136 [Escherichia phage UE-S1]|nr:hypothetical protein UES1_136 [Escherichia phage UE-S1]